MENELTRAVDLAPSGGQNTDAGCLRDATANAARSVVRMSDVHKSFGKTPVLKGVDLTVDGGQAVCIIGPSGSGKSTILRCINGLVPIDAGDIFVEDIAVHQLNSDRAKIELRKKVSMVFQQFNLFPHMTVLENITFAPMKVFGQSRSEAESHAAILLRKVRLFDMEKRYPGELSGGQQQRVAIARSLAMRPDIMLFDEVTASLDPETVKEVLLAIRELVDEGMTSILVTHEMRFAQEISSEIHFTDGGVIVESAPPKDFFASPKSERAREFLDKML